MALKAGRVGLNKELVDEFGYLKGEAPSGEYYTKTQTDNKFETKTHANNTFQKQTLEVPVELLSGSALTVEDALHGLSDASVNVAETVVGNIISTADTPTTNVVRKIGRMVIVDLIVKVNSATAWGTPLGKIPSDYRPLNRIDTEVFYAGNVNMITVDESGNISLGANIETSTNVRYHAVWFV